MTGKTFHQLCELMPPDFVWGDPCTPGLVKHIIDAALHPQQTSLHRRLVEHAAQLDRVLDRQRLALLDLMGQRGAAKE